MTKMFFVFLLCSPAAFAFDSTISISEDELKSNDTVLGLSASGPDQLTTAGARILQLQIKAVGCSPVMIVPRALKSKATNDFLMTSANCQVKNKSEKCDAGFAPRNMLPNPRSPSDSVVGLNNYAICISNGPSAPAGDRGTSSP